MSDRNRYIEFILGYLAGVLEFDNYESFEVFQRFIRNRERYSSKEVERFFEDILFSKKFSVNPLTRELITRLVREQDFFDSLRIESLIREINYRRYEFRRDSDEFQSLLYRNKENIISVKDELNYYRNELNEIKTEIKKIEKLSAKIRKDNDNSSDELHNYIWERSLGIDENQLSKKRFIPVKIYLPEEPNSGKIKNSLNQAIIDFASENGFEVAYDYKGEIGSWWKRFWFKTKENLKKEEVKEKLDKAERALELNYLDKPQSEANKNQAEAASCLIKSLESVPNACIQTGSLLLVKVTVDGNSSLMSKTLSLKELKYLEENQSLLKNPNMILDWLQGSNQKSLDE